MMEGRVRGIKGRREGRKVGYKGGREMVSKMEQHKEKCEGHYHHHHHNHHHFEPSSSHSSITTISATETDAQH